MNSLFRLTVMMLGTLFLMSAAAQGQLENHYTFDDKDNVTADSSGNGRDGFLDDFDVEWVDDDARGGVLEFAGNTAGFVVAEVPDLTEEFTIMMWAYRDADLCCGAGGANDGLFQVQFGDDDPEQLLPPSTSTKVIGGWVQKSDAAVWGRVITADGNNNLDTGSFFMEDDEWTHFAYRGTGDEFEVVVNGMSGEGPILDYDGPSLLEHDTIYIGRQGTETWGGRLDDFRVYSKALTDEEIQAIMNPGPPALLGDFNENGMLDVPDIDLLAGEIRAGTNDMSFDLDNNGVVNDEDHRVWVEDLKNTWFGDSNLDLEFNSGDLVVVFGEGKYDTGEAAGWAQGDWDADGVFASGDLVKAFQAAGFEVGPRPAAAAVPEPAGILLWVLGCAMIGLRKRLA